MLDGGLNKLQKRMRGRFSDMVSQLGVSSGVFGGLVANSIQVDA